MPFAFGGTGTGTGGGGGLHFRDPVDVFADAAARSTAFSTGGTLAGEHVQFANDRSLAIIIGTIANPVEFQTYTGDTGTYDDSDWVDRIDAVEGPPGPQGRYFIRQWINAVAGTTPPTPTGGTYNVDTETLTPSAGWSATETTPATGEESYASAALINPATQSGDVTPTWGTPQRWEAFGKQGSFFIQVYQNADENTRPTTPTDGQFHVENGTLTPPTGWVATPTAPGAGEATWVSEAFINPMIQTGNITPTWQLPHTRGDISSLFTIVNVTGVGPPAASAMTIPHLYLDVEIPRAWLTRTERLYTNEPVGNFNTYTHANYVGDYTGQPPSGTLTAAGQYWYRHGTTHSWYRYDGSLSRAVNASTVLGVTATWLGDARDRQTALNRIDNFDNARSYIFYNEDSGDVEILDNTSYSAQTVTLLYAYAALILEQEIDEILNAIQPGAGVVIDRSVEGQITITAQAAAVDADTVRMLLGLTQAELDSLLVGDGAQISGGVIMIPQNDGSTLSLTLPAGAVADGVINSLTISGTTLTAGTSTGGSVTLDLTTYFDPRYLNQPLNLSDLPDVAQARVNLEVLNQDEVREQAVGSFVLGTAFPASPYAGLKMLFTADATGLTNAVDENAAAVTEAVAGDLFEYDATDTRWERRLRIAVQPAPVGDHTRYAAFSADNTFTETEWLAGNTSQSNTITFPVTTIQHYKGFAIPATVASLTDIRQVGNIFNERASYAPAVGDPDILIDINGVSHKTYIGTSPEFASPATVDFELS